MYYLVVEEIEQVTTPVYLQIQPVAIHPTAVGQQGGQQTIQVQYAQPITSTQQLTNLQFTGVTPQQLSTSQLNALTGTNSNKVCSCYLHVQLSIMLLSDD